MPASAMMLSGGGSSLPTPPTAPADAGNLIMWYRADFYMYTDSAGTAPATSDGDGVRRWKDLQATGHDAVRVSNSPASLRLSPTGFNGMPALEFDQTANQLFTLDDISALTAGEVFSVFRNRTNPPNLGINAKGNIHNLGMYGDGTGGGDYVPYGGDGNIYTTFGSNALVGLGAAPTNLSSGAHLFNAYSATNDKKVYIDGTQHGSSITSNTVSFPSTNIGTGAALLGCAINPGYGFDGWIAEFLLYSVKLSGGDRTTVTSYLKTRYGIA